MSWWNEIRIRWRSCYISQCCLFYSCILLALYNLTRLGTSKSNFNCLYNPLTTIHLPYGLTLTSPASEKGPLLTARGETGYYKLHTQGPLHSSGMGAQQLISALTFIPQISLHKGAVFKCQVAYAGKDKIVQERVSERFTILCKDFFYSVLKLFIFVYFHICSVCLSYSTASPEVSEIQLAETENDPGKNNRLFISMLSNILKCFYPGLMPQPCHPVLPDVIRMTVGASHFHPDVITFRWFCQGGELSPVASQASSSPRPNSEGFFSAFSQCKLPRSELEKGVAKVWVSVHHIALKQPVTRETRGVNEKHPPPPPPKKKPLYVPNNVPKTSNNNEPVQLIQASSKGRKCPTLSAAPTLWIRVWIWDVRLPISTPQTSQSLGWSSGMEKRMIEKRRW